MGSLVKVLRAEWSNSQKVNNIIQFLHTYVAFLHPDD